MLTWIAGLVCLSAPAQPAHVTVVLERVPGPAVGIRIVLPGDEDGHTSVSLADGWGGIEGAGREIGAVGARDQRGTALDVTPEADHRWSVLHAPGEMIEVAYELTPHDREELPAGHNDYRPLVRDGLFHAIGNHALLLPEDGDAEVLCALRWQGFEGWTLASSLGPGAAPAHALLSIDDLRSCFFIGGEPPRVRLAKRDLPGGAVGLAVIDADWGFTDDRLMDLVMDVVRVERDFFADHTDPWFLVALTPNGGRASGQSFSLGGTGLTDCFALYCNTGLDLAPGGAHTEHVLRLLAHEYFHTWNGRKLRIDAPEGAAYWFSEGFTDFYARRLLRQAGLFADEGYLGSLNRSLADFDGNPLRHAPNERIVADFWNDAHVGALPYRRGDLLALAIDEAIAAKSGGAESLDDLMRELHARAASGAPPLTPEQLFDRFAEETSPEAAAAIRACVIHGAEPPVPETIEGGSLVLTTGRMREGADGFDVTASLESGVVCGVVEGSGAFDAGLRDGQRVSSVERLPPVAGPSRLKVRLVQDDSALRTLVFEAVSPPRTVRRYVPAGG
ncbi:MAG TPA: hypothetical protein VFF69_09520 [Phycisphaerales bacterium]|nr:hypothetical protein [Phycisphaerales bacterium]